MASNLQLRSRIQDISQLSREDRECIQAFGTEIDCLVAKNRNEACAPNTGQWFFSHQSYQDFRREDASQVLFVTAEAGSGKSTVMRTVVDHLQSSQPPPLVAYFFFKDDNDIQRSYSEALGAVIHQLLIQRPALIEHARQPHQQYSQRIKTQTGVMWQILTAFAMDGQDDIVLVLDALDECEVSGRSQLLKDMKHHMQQMETTKSYMKFVVSSRPYQDRYHPYEDLINCSPKVHHLDGENARFTSDIFNVISFKADELIKTKKLPESTRQLLIDRILTENVQTKTFLWVKLAFELLGVDPRLRPGAGDRTIDAILASIPESIGEQFEQLLQTSSDPTHARKLLSVILAARRPLKVAELKVVYGLTKRLDKTGTPKTYDDLEMLQDNDDFKTLVRNTCGLFITFVKGSVHLFHQTAREYLMVDASKGSDVPPQQTQSSKGAEVTTFSEQSNLWRHSITSQQANYVIGKACLDLICFDASEKWVRKVFQDWALGNFRDTIQDYLSTRPFLSYAACNWYEHLLLSSEAIQHDACRRDNAKMFDVGLSQFWVWFLIACDQVCLSQTIMSDRWKDEMTTHVWTDLDSFGKTDRGLFLRSECMQKMSCVDSKIGALFYDYQPPADSRTIIDGLPWTTTGGYHLIDEFHLENGDWSHTSMSKAVSALEEGIESASQVLLENISGSTLIWTTIHDGKPKALKRVLADTTDVAWLNHVPEHMLGHYRERRSAMRVVRWGHASDEKEQRRRPVTFETFIKTNALPSGGSVFSVLANWLESSPSARIFAPKLWNAGAFVNGLMCRTLFDHGAQLDCLLWQDQIPALHIAATFWEHDSLQTLLDLGADAIVTSLNGWNALHWLCFAQGGPTKEKEQEIFSHRYKKAQIKASFDRIVDAVVEKRNIIEHQGEEGITPLMLAVNVSSTITRSLLEHGAEVDRTDKCGRTALMHFFIDTERRIRPRSVLRLLLLFGADARLTDNYGVNTIGHWAQGLLSMQLAHLYPGHNTYNTDFHALNTCDALSSADVMADYLKPLKIPLVVAARLGNAQLCEYLLFNGAAANDHGMDDGSPMATNSGSESNDLEDLSWNPFMVAILKKAYVTAALLLENGADIHFEVCSEKLGSYSSFELGTTALHLLVGTGKHGWDLQMVNGTSWDGCTFEAAGRPEKHVYQESGLEKLGAYQQKHYRRIDPRYKDDTSSEAEMESVRCRPTNDSTSSYLLPFDRLVRNEKSKSQVQEPLLDVIYGNETTAHQKQQALVEIMLRRGANVNARTQTGITPLFACARNGQTELAKLLLSYQADVGSVADNGCTALMWASRTGKRDLVELLLDHGADVDAQAHAPAPELACCYKFEERTVLCGRGGTCYAPVTSLAVAAERGHYSVVKLLLDRGANPNLRIVHHTHGLLQAKDRMRRIKARRKKTPPNSDSESDSNVEPEIWKGYISVATALTWARGEVHELLLEHGADPAVEEPIRECGCVVEEIESD